MHSGIGSTPGVTVTFPLCAVCGAVICGYHCCVTPLTQTAPALPWKLVQTPWGTWEKRLG